MTNSDFARFFSIGEFEKTFDVIADNAVWIVVEESETVGKASIIEKCREISQYFRSVQTDFKVLNIISGESMVAVNGTAEFSRDGKPVSFISASDIYEFNGQGQIEKITSYCIQRK